MAFLQFFKIAFVDNIDTMGRALVSKPERIVSLFIKIPTKHGAIFLWDRWHRLVDLVWGQVGYVEDLSKYVPPLQVHLIKRVSDAFMMHNHDCLANHGAQRSLAVSTNVTLLKNDEEV